MLSYVSSVFYRFISNGMRFLQLKHKSLERDLRIEAFDWSRRRESNPHS